MLIIDRLVGLGRRRATTDDGIDGLGRQIGSLSNKVEGFAIAITANSEMCVRLTSSNEESERRLTVVEGLGSAFTAHAAKDVAEHAEMMRSIERLGRSSENVQAQLARLTPADTFRELLPRDPR